MRSLLPCLSVTLAAALGAPAARAADQLSTPNWPDFAAVEAGGKCPGIIQGATDANTIASWSQEQLDELYACLRAGPIPDGFLQGTVILAPGGGFDQFVQISAGLGIPISADALKTFAQMLWQGKQFYRNDHALLNKMGPDVQPILGQNIAGQMRFPAKVYCGQSLLDGRRESIVIDYAFSDTVKIGGQSPYSDAIDWIAAGTTQTGRRGLAIRDEIRMVHPGFYLGRAYTDSVFLLNFTLTAAPADGNDTCWPGYAFNN